MHVRGSRACAGFAAIKNDGTVVSWGVDGSNVSSIADQLVNVQAVVGGGARFAALRANGSVVCWGPELTCPPALSSGVVSMCANVAGIYLALKADGSAVVFGASIYGSQMSSSVLNQLASATDISTIDCSSRYHLFATTTSGGLYVIFANYILGGSGPIASGLVLPSGVTQVASTYGERSELHRTCCSGCGQHAEQQHASSSVLRQKHCARSLGPHALHAPHAQAPSRPCCPTALWCCTASLLGGVLPALMWLPNLPAESPACTPPGTALWLHAKPTAAWLRGATRA